MIENKTEEFKKIEDIRKVMGTLPSEHPVVRTDIEALKDVLEVTLEDSSENPYKTMFVTSTSTWGDNEFQRKWPITSLEGKLAVIQAVLTHKTLPQAKEMVQFVFRVKGVPRWLFDYHTQIPFTAFMSIGCRDNNKADSSVVKDKIEGDREIFESLKDLYVSIVGDNQGTWQSARAFLPQSYLHSYHFGQNMLSIVGTKGFHASKKFDLNDHRDYALSIVYEEIVKQIGMKFPLLGLYCQILFKDNEYIFNKIRNLQVSDLHSSDLELFNKD